MTGKHSPLSKLTRKQREVLELVADNRTSKEIAAILRISESAVNQRIESVRSRLGCLPRGELARLYRQTQPDPSGNSLENPDTCKKIQVPQPVRTDQGGRAESIFAFASGSHRSTAKDESGSQRTAPLFRTDNTWLWRKNGVTALVRVFVTTAIITAALGFAAVASGVLAFPG